MRIRRVFVVAAVPLVAATPWWGPLLLRQFRFFDVRRIEVVGAHYLAPAAVIEALGLKPGASVWSDVGAMERRVRSLGGVEAVEISRGLPSTLHVEVTETEPVALAAGPSGLVPVGPDTRPLPYDPAVAPVDAPVVGRADTPLIAALAAVRSADPGLFAEVAAARTDGGGGGEVVLQLDGGRLRLGTPVDAAVVRAVSAVRRDLVGRGRPWKELDGRFQGWVVVRGARPTAVPARAGATRRAARSPVRRPGRTKAT